LSNLAFTFKVSLGDVDYSFMFINTVYPRDMARTARTWKAAIVNEDIVFLGSMRISIITIFIVTRRLKFVPPHPCVVIMMPAYFSCYILYALHRHLP